MSGEEELLHDHLPGVSGGEGSGPLPWHQVSSLIVVGDVASVD